MLSTEEKACVSEFFEDFPSADLYALALVISKRNLQPTSRDDALNIICQHVDCMESLLERKKISKQYLSQYLHRHKVSITLSWDKPALIRKLLEYWSSQGRVSSNQISNDSFQPPIAMTAYYNELTTKYSEWFYSIINDQSLSDLRPEHFFIDAQMKIVVQNGNSDDVIESTNAVDVVQALRQLQLTFRFVFSPNLSPDAMKYQTNVYGHIMLIVGGTLHTCNVSQVVGVFEQMFLLLRDVNDQDNWKIKNSQIRLRSTTNNNTLTSSVGTQNFLPIS